jgi:type III restriction enzyme
MDAVANVLKYELHRLLVDGIKYERIDGAGPESAWEMMLFKNDAVAKQMPNAPRGGSSNGLVSSHAPC